VAVVNVVSLVGEVLDRPFRPGNGARTVVKIKVHDDESDRFDRVEFDAFGQPGEFGARLYVGDRVAIRGRLENRMFHEDGEEVHELRVVANHIELIMRAADRKPPVPAPSSAPTAD
jgi:single-stranded DNA-binding protein